MFIVNPPTEIREQIEETTGDENDQESRLLDVDLEFNELELDALEDTMDLEFSELDIDFLDVDYLTDLLDVIEELEKTTVVFSDAQETSSTSKLCITMQL